MRAYSMDLRERVLRDSDAGLPADQRFKHQPDCYSASMSTVSGR